MEVKYQTSQVCFTPFYLKPRANNLSKIEQLSSIHVVLLWKGYCS